MKGILIAAHGSKVKEVNEEFFKLIELVNKNVDKVVYGANLSLTPPFIDSTIDTMVSEGVEEIVLVPYFLNNGKHVSEHIPEIVKNKTEEYKSKNIKITQTSSLCLNSFIVEALTDIISKSS